MSNVIPFENLNLSTMISSEALAKMDAMYDKAMASFGNSSVPTLTFGGRDFHVKFGGEKTTLDSRIIDAYIVAWRDVDHLTFYEKTFDESKSDEENGKGYSRDMTPNDPLTRDWRADDKYKSRSRKRRAVLILDGDTDNRLVIADFGELSIYGETNQKAGLYNFATLCRKFREARERHPQAYPFTVKVQLSFTASTQPVVQFSFMDQRNRDAQYRPAPQYIIERAIEAHTNNEIQPLLDLWINEDEPQGQAQQSSEPQPQPQPRKQLDPVYAAPQDELSDEMSEW